MNVTQARAPCRVLVLLSGGLDSAACVALYVEKNFDVECLFVDYGQPGGAPERRAAKAVSSHYGVRLRESKADGLPIPGSGFVFGRNALLVCTALVSSEGHPGLLALGIHSGTPYVDCGQRFLVTCQALIDLYAEGCLRVVAPFLEWTKGDIQAYAKKAEVPRQLTYSCEMGSVPPCGTCLSCLDHARGQ